MGITELILIAVGLSMDAFAVSVCKGLAMQKIKFRHYLTVGIWFGGFQALMPTLGYFLGSAFEHYIVAIDHWVAFILLALIGGNMIKEALSAKSECEDCTNASLGAKIMLVMAIATSIDAMAVGITFAFLIQELSSLIFAVLSIGITTFLLSAIGVKVGNVFGIRYKAKAELTGGIILILIGTKILLEHLGIIAF